MRSVLLFTLLTVATFNNLLAQKFSLQLQSMVDAENAFAKFSKEKNMRDAFLANLTDSTILFAKDGPIKGKQSWVDRQPSTNLLFWWPVFVGISGNNDMGFSTGPWQWSESKESQPVAHGYFVTVWEKVGSEWKLAADIGSPMPGADASAAALHSSNPMGKAPKGKDVKGLLIDIDRKYNDQLRKDGALYKSESFSKDAMLKYPRAFPDYFPFESKSTLANADFKSMGGDMSTSNDLGYTYGTVSASIQDNNSLVPYTANFLRVWKYENNGWKIVIEVVSGNG
ncbi:MAG TPA: nuclear transport factor 2 family protein [Chryseolinea sp.]|nr:nuclear transport factor 2 family protein [Chryseolinea sp.]